MKRNLLSLLAVITVLLAGCNLTNVLPTADLVVALVDGADEARSQITLTRTFVDLEDADGNVIAECSVPSSYVIQSMRVKAFARPGSMGAYIENFSTDYFTAQGNRIATATGESFRGSLAMNVPPGLSCGEEATECSLTSGGTYTNGPVVYSAGISPIDDDVAGAIFASPTSEGSYASIQLEGTDYNGNYYSKLISPVTIVVFATCG